MKTPLEKAIGLLQNCWAVQTEESDPFPIDVDAKCSGEASDYSFASFIWEDDVCCYHCAAWARDNPEVEVKGDRMFLVTRTPDDELEEKPLELRLLVPMDLEAACPLRSERVPDPMKIDEVMFLAQGPCATPCRS